MDTANLITAIDNVLPMVPPVEAAEYLLPLQVYKVIQGGAGVDARLVKLVEVLRAEPELAQFDGYMHAVGGSAIRVEFYHFVSWLLIRSKAVGADSALEGVRRYLESDTLEFSHTFAIGGIRVTDECQLTHTLTLVPWEAVPASGSKRHVRETYERASGIHRPTAAVIERLTLPRGHVSPDELETIHRSPVSKDDAQDAILCLGLFGPTSPHILAQWFELPEWAPSPNVMFGMPHVEGFTITKELPEDAYTDGPTLVGAMLKKSEPRRKLLRLAMARLNSALRSATHVDGAIDLGIALEAMFLTDQTDDRGEMSLRLRIRAARYLTVDAKERARIFRLVGDLYTARSVAVHTGTVPERVRTLPVADLLQQGFALTASALRRLVVESDPDWELVTLS